MQFSHMPFTGGRKPRLYILARLSTLSATISVTISLTKERVSLLLIAKARILILIIVQKRIFSIIY